MSQIRQLLDLIKKSVEILEKTCAANGTEVPDLHSTFSPASEAFRSDPVASEAADIISAAGLQLSAIVAPPVISLYNAVGGHWRAAAVRLCLDSHVTEILREAGPEGLHIDEIAAKNGINKQKLARCLRFLATGHIYREVKPNVFANTRISSMLDTLKTSEEILADPLHKYDGTSGLAAFASHHLDECFKSSSYLLENEQDPRTASSEDPDAAPFARAVSKGKSFMDFLVLPDQEYVSRRFNTGMLGFKAMLSDNAILEAYDWKSLPDNAILVDVGGGIGTTSMILARNFEHLQIVIQDRPPVLKDAVEFWDKELPGVLSSGRVKLEVQDFFEAQPSRNASVFFLKSVFHDWSDAYCLKILKHLRDAATSDTKLIIIDCLIPYACHDPDAANSGIEGLVTREAPAPLLANWGAPKELAYVVDMTMLTLCNSFERTVAQFDQLLRCSGWNIVAVRRPTGVDMMLMASIEAVPIL
ncbi:hypothetical protein APHAL10511_004663 [Amanita phalloides]|nr:hypothetical protein APHAL10511_004663 [Amanita phalloides]